VSSYRNPSWRLHPHDLLSTFIPLKKASVSKFITLGIGFSAYGFGDMQYIKE
jgi:hypothetical protein